MTDLSNLSEDELLALRSAALRAGALQNRPIGVGEDSFRSFFGGFNRSLAALAGLPGEVMRGSQHAGMFVERKLRGETPEQYAARQARGDSSFSANTETPITLPSTAHTTRTMESVIGPTHHAQTMLGRQFESLGENVVNAASPGGPFRKAAQVVAPAFVGQAAYELLPESLKTAGKIAGNIGGSLAASLRVPRIGANNNAEQILSEHVTPEALQTFRKYGPEAFVADSSPSFSQIAQGVAQRPGSSAERIWQALSTRQEHAPSRLEADVRTSFGPPISPHRIEAHISKADSDLSALYQAALRSRPNDAGLILQSLRADIDQLARRRDAMNNGRQVLETGKDAIWPSQLAEMRAKMTPAERISLRIGTRSEIERILGTAGRDINAVRNLVKSDGKWNHEKLALIFGKTEAENVMKSVDREVAFNQSYQRFANSLSTARGAEETTRKGSLLPQFVAGSAGIVANSPEVAISGIAAASATKRFLENVAASGQKKFAAALTDRLLLQGPTGDAKILDLLARQKASRNHTRDMLVRALLAGSSSSANARAPY